MHSKYSVLECNMSFKNSEIDYCTNFYYPYIAVTTNLDKEKIFYLKKVFVYKNMFICSSSNYRFIKHGFLYFNIVDNA